MSIVISKGVISNGGTTNHAELENLGFGASGHTGFVPEAPSDSKTYGRNNEAWVEVSGGGGDVRYSGVAERTVGGINEGQTFTNATMTTMWDSLIKQEKFPTLTNPSSTFTASITGLREVGEIINITFSSTFTRGSINPQYTADSQFRSGLPNTYIFTGPVLTNQSKTTLTDSQTITGHTVTLGNQSWTGRVAYDAGVQPKSSYDNNFNTPLPAGQTSNVTRTITGVYPIFATTIGISTQSKQTLIAHNSTYYQVNMVAESGINKQRLWISSSHNTVTGIQFFNTVSNQWEWIGGSKSGSLGTFTLSSTTINIQGNTVNYNVYTHNGSLSGARQLRFYTN